MSKKDDVEDIRAKMESIRKQKEKSREPAVSGNANTLESINQLIMPTVEAFVKQDRSLAVQYSDIQDIFIAYGFHKVCRLSISTQGDRVEIDIQHDSGMKTPIYSGNYGKKNLEKQIKESVKEGLLQWYTSLFS